MAEPVRRAGQGRRDDGAVVTWTVAEGRKGRRWREVVVRDGAIVHSLLLETSPDRRFAHLELATPAGLLTLHPEGDGTLHGNAVTASGIRHVAGLAWPADAIVALEGSAVSAAAASGPPAPGAVLRIGLDLGLRLQTGASERDRRATDDGLPVLLDGRDWPLELAE